MPIRPQTSVFESAQQITGHRVVRKAVLRNAQAVNGRIKFQEVASLDAHPSHYLLVLLQAIFVHRCVLLHLTFTVISLLRHVRRLAAQSVVN